MLISQIKHRRATTLEDRMHHLETLIQAIPPAVFAAGGAMPQRAAGPSSEPATSPILPFMYPDGLSSGVPPPSLHVFPLMNPSNHFTREPKVDERHHSYTSLVTGGPFQIPSAEHPTRMSLTASYLYIDDEGYIRWQGETSGLPVLDLLVERRHTPDKSTLELNAPKVENATSTEWFPDRQPRRTDVNAQALWRLITASIEPELMDRYGDFCKLIYKT